MIYIADHEIDRLLLEDIAMGDITSRSLGLSRQPGVIQYTRRRGGRVSGVAIAARVLQKCGLTVDFQIDDGSDQPANTCLLRAYGRADALHQGWKVAQNILEWCGGVADAMTRMLGAARSENTEVQIACTRKSIPGTRLMATQAILDGGGLIHRCGTAETVLLFANHRRFFPQPFDWKKHVAQLRRNAPEKKIVVEADSMDEMRAALAAQPDAIQCDKFSLQELRECCALVRQSGSSCLLLAAGGINGGNVAEFAATGVTVLVTSSPYYVKPADIEVLIAPE
jgi:putative molybdenum utilization protein ModD